MSVNSKEPEGSTTFTGFLCQELIKPPAKVIHYAVSIVLRESQFGQVLGTRRLTLYRLPR